MRNTIAVMNTKGGVGKSTLVLAIAETLSAKFGKNVLIIDSDAQASVSLMLLSAGNLNRLQLEGMTIVDYWSRACSRTSRPIGLVSWLPGCRMWKNRAAFF